MKIRSWPSVALAVPILLCSFGCSGTQSPTPAHARAQNEPVQTFLQLLEANQRCVASHPGRGHGERCEAPYIVGRFIDRLVHKNDGALLAVMHSPKVPIKEKKAILQGGVFT